MRCMFCNAERPAVVDSRPSGNDVRRRYQCRRCNKRFSTREVFESGDPRHVYASKKQVRQPRVYYTVYESKTDELVAFGTAIKCAEMMLISVESFYSIVSKFKSGESEKYFIVSEKTEAEDLI